MGGEGHRWFGRREPRVELAPRYKMHGRFPAAKTSSRFTARIDAPFDLLRPGADELAAILCHARNRRDTRPARCGAQHHPAVGAFGDRVSTIVVTSPVRTS